jgi:hypothetical protein
MYIEVTRNVGFDLIFMNKRSLHKLSIFSLLISLLKERVKRGLSYTCMPQNKNQMLFSVGQIGSTGLISNFSTVEYVNPTTPS